MDACDSCSARHFHGVAIHDSRQHAVAAVKHNIFLFVLAFFLTVGGTYGAVMDVIQSSSDGGPWSCNDNSHSV